MSPAAPSSSPTGTVEVVFLDAGGVLVAPSDEAIVAHLAAIGLEVDPGALFEAHYHGVHAIDVARAEPEVFDDYHLAYTAHLGIPEERLADAAAVMDALWQRSSLWTQPLPWAAEGLAAIAAAGVPIVIVSNADGSVAQMLAIAGLCQVGPGPGTELLAVIDSGAVGVAKPDPAIFELALAAAGTTADRAIHVGDAYQYDVRGARAAGIEPVLVDPLGLRHDVDCRRVASLIEVVALL